MYVLRGFLQVIDTINRWVAKVISWLFVPMVAFAMYEVISRYIFSKATIWVWEVNTWFMAALTVLLGGYILLEKGHVNVDVLVRNLSPRTRAIIDLITSILFFVGIIVLLLSSIDQAANSFSMREQSVGIFEGPLYIIKMVFPLGAGLLLLQGIAKFIRDILTVMHYQEGSRL